MNIRKRIVFAECNCLEFQLINAEFLCHSSAKGDLLSFAMKVDSLNKFEVLFSEDGNQNQIRLHANWYFRCSARSENFHLIQSRFEYIAITVEISDRQQCSALSEWLWIAPVFGWYSFVTDELPQI